MIEAPYSLMAELEKVRDRDRPPIHLWNPDNVKDIDIVIRRDGAWEHEGTVITRPRLVRLFATVLRLEDDGDFYLVTPVEKCGIRVEDAPFQAISGAVLGESESRQLTFTTNMAEEVSADADHPIRIELDANTGEPSPYVMVRDGLEALISRNVYYELVELLDTQTVDGEEWAGVWSGGTFFRFIKSEEIC